MKAQRLVLCRHKQVAPRAEADTPARATPSRRAQRPATFGTPTSTPPYGQPAHAGAPQHKLAKDPLSGLLGGSAGKVVGGLLGSTTGKGGEPSGGPLGQGTGFA